MILLSLIPPHATAGRLVSTRLMAQFIFTLRLGVAEIFPECHLHMNPPFVPRDLDRKIRNTTVSPPPHTTGRCCSEGGDICTVALSVYHRTCTNATESLDNHRTST